jgi:hypothetical protein
VSLEKRTERLEASARYVHWARGLADSGALRLPIEDA